MGSLALPDDLITEILLRLPVKSILRFMLGCHNWNTIIKSPGFVHSHCHTGNKFTSNLVRWQEFDNEEEEEEEFGDDKRCCIIPDDDEDEGTLERYEIPPPSGQYHDMYGACNGIVCVKDDNGAFALWNPATRKLRQLPSHPYMKDFEVGFGSDPTTNVLKIVLVDRNCKERQFSVYNSTEDSWTSFEEGVHFDPADSYLRINFGRSFSNGISYWMKTNRVTSKTTMLTFDMHNNSFQEMEMPKIDFQNGEDAVTGFLDDTLVLFVWKFCLKPMPINVWLMKERGCWTLHKTVLRNSYLFDFGVWKGDQIYASDDSNNIKELIIFDQDFGNSRRLGEIGFPTYIYRYKESLISV